MLAVPPRTRVVDELDVGALLDEGAALLEDFTLELDCCSELLVADELELCMELLDNSKDELDSGNALLDEGITNTHSFTAISGASAKHTFVSGSTMLKSPASTWELSQASTGESSVTFWLPGNGSSACLGPPPWLMYPAVWVFAGFMLFISILVISTAIRKIMQKRKLKKGGSA